MRARTYISLQGPAFDPIGFQAEVGSSVPGEVKHRKHSGAPLQNVPLVYWASTISQGTHEDVGHRLSALLRDIAPFVQRLTDKSRIQLLAHVVLEYEEGEEPVGLNFSEKVIEQLKDVGAGLDIDAVPRIADR